MRLIIGLGNPDKRYEKTRHNAGFLAVDILYKRLLALDLVKSWKERPKLFSLIAEGMLNDERIVLAKPATFMNESGRAVAALARFFRVKPKDILVIHDDKDLAMGTIKQQTGRGHAGHNGVRSIIESLGTKEFSRMRIGIVGETQTEKETVDFVLGRWTKKEEKTIQETIENAVEKILQE